MTRLFSSHDADSRTVWLDPGTHTHNVTTFTKPGRYEVTFDATARTADGAFIASKPTTLVWRVGGTNPADEKLGDVRTAYNDAANVTGTSSPNFTIAGSNVPARSRGALISTGPAFVVTAFARVPLRELPSLEPPFSCLS